MLSFQHHEAAEGRGDSEALPDRSAGPRSWPALIRLGERTRLGSRPWPRLVHVTAREGLVRDRADFGATRIDEVGQRLHGAVPHRAERPDQPALNLGVLLTPERG